VNKVIASLGLFLTIGSIICASEREIRRHLNFLYDNYAINYAQITENNMGLLEVIDRDIAIMENHIVRLQNKIDSKKGIWAQTVSPFTKSCISSICGLTSAFFGYLLYDSLFNNCVPDRISAVCGISLCTGMIALKSTASRYKHFLSIEKSIKKWKAQIIKNNAIIATLKELKYQF
jgi:hypothetical protein